MKLHLTQTLFVALICYFAGGILAATEARSSERLYAAVESGNLNFVKEFVAEGGDVISRFRNLRYPQDNGITPFYLAVKSNKPEIVEFLLEVPGIDPNDGPHTGSPLIKAILDTNTEMVKVLLTRSDIVDVNLPNGFTFRPLHYVCAGVGRNVELFEALLQAGANLDVLDHKGKRPLDRANPEFFRELEELRGAEPYVLK